MNCLSYRIQWKKSTVSFGWYELYIIKIHWNNIKFTYKWYGLYIMQNFEVLKLIGYINGLYERPYCWGYESGLFREMIYGVNFINSQVSVKNERNLHFSMFMVASLHIVYTIGRYWHKKIYEVKCIFLSLS